MNNYSPEDLILYLYNEMPAAEKVALEDALQKDWTLREKLSVLKTAHDRLNTLKETPRTETVLNILRYAAKTEKVLPR